MIIYKILNKINKHFYIGKDAKNNPNYYGSGLLIKKAILKYGKDNFEKQIIDKCKNLNELSEKEIYWIDKLKTIL